MDKPDISLNIYHARVVAGACWLDAKMSGWENKVDLPSFDMSMPCKCILGQLQGDYLTAVVSFLTCALAEAWGFNLSNDDFNWKILREAWVYEILSRREIAAISIESGSSQ